MPFVNHSDERGSASLEFLALGLLLIVPLVYLILVLGQLQAAALAADGAARQAARSWVMQPSLTLADERAADQVRLGASDFGFSGAEVRWQRNCIGSCLSPSSRVSIEVQIAVPLPLMPPVLGGQSFGTITMRGVATQTVSRFDGAG